MLDLYLVAGAVAVIGGLVAALVAAAKTGATARVKEKLALQRLKARAKFDEVLAGPRLRGNALIRKLRERSR